MTEYWRGACLDWQERIKAGKSLVPDFPLNIAEADRAVSVFNKLRLPDVVDNPPMATAAGDWFRDILRALYGSLDPETGHRRLTEAFVMVPKKSSKTTGSAAIMVTALLLNKRPRAELLMIAPTLEVADLAFGQAVGMIALDPVLERKLHVQAHLRKITYRPTGAFLKVVSFDPKTATGRRPVVVLLDELHVISASSDADRVIGQLRGGMISNPEGFMLTITTQSERPPAGVFKSELTKARAVRDGAPNAPAGLLPVLYEFPADVDWRDTKNWGLVTPNMGRSITLDRLINDYNGALSSGEGELRRWASQHLNTEVGLALASDAWAGAEYWEAAGDEDLTLDRLIEHSDVVTVGVDGGGLDDLLGLCVLGRDAVTRRWLVWNKAWAHTSVLERRKSEVGRFRDYERDGDLAIVDRLGDDIEQITAIIEHVADSGKLDKVGLDPVGIGAIVDALAKRGIQGDDRVVGVSQGWKLSGAIKTAERKLAEGALIHGGSPLMAWCVGNAKVEPKGNALTITKQAAGTAKIDPLMAMFNAVALMAMNPTAPRATGRMDSFLSDPIAA